MTRIDDTRLALTVLTKMFEFLQYKKVDPELMSNQVQRGYYKDLAEQTLFIINMYFVENVQQHDQALPGRRYQPNVNRETKLLST
jgi:hypothetical protein